MAKKTKSKFKPLFWITGNYHDCCERWKYICGKLKDPNVQVMHCGRLKTSDATAGDIIMMLKNRDIFDTRPRIIKMKGLPDDYAILADYLHLVDNDNVLVVDGPIACRAKPPSTRLITAKTSKFFKAFQSQGEVFDSPIEGKSNGEAMEWLTGVLDGRDRSIEKEAADMMVEMIGRNYDALYAEILKLCDYQLSRKITKEDVIECCISLFHSTVWDLVDSLDKQDYDSAINYMQRFYEVAGTEHGESFFGDVQKFFGALTHHYLFLLSLKDTCGQAISYEGAIKAVEGLKKRTKKGGEYHWSNDMFDKRFVGKSISMPNVRAVQNWPKRKMYSVYRAVLYCRTQTRFLSSNPAAVKVLLDALIMHICDKLSYTQMESMTAKYN